MRTIEKSNHILRKFYPGFGKGCGYVLCKDFHLHPISCGNMQSGLCSSPTFSTTKTLELVELPPFFVDDSKVFTAKVKANIAEF